MGAIYVIEKYHVSVWDPIIINFAMIALVNEFNVNMSVISQKF